MFTLYFHSFEGSVHNYMGIRDTHQFAKAVTNLFLGFTLKDPKLDGNPWIWDEEDWNLPANFNISRDFPSIEIWQIKINSVLLGLCFRHKIPSDSYKGQNENSYNYNNNDDLIYQRREDSTNYVDDNNYVDVNDIAHQHLNTPTYENINRSNQCQINPLMKEHEYHNRNDERNSDKKIIFNVKINTT